jgi:hypothetical protein
LANGPNGPNSTQAAQLATSFPPCAGLLSLLFSFSLLALTSRPHVVSLSSCTRGLCRCHCLVGPLGQLDLLPQRTARRPRQTTQQARDFRAVLPLESSLLAATNSSDGLYKTGALRVVHFTVCGLRRVGVEGLGHHCRTVERREK